MHQNVPGAVDSLPDLTVASEALVFREKPVKQWTGPFKFLNIEGKICHIDIRGRNHTKSSIDKVKPHLEGGDESPDKTSADHAGAERSTAVHADSAPLLPITANAFKDEIAPLGAFED